MKTRIRFLIVLLLFLPVVAIGQAVIGSVLTPKSYSLLELSTTTVKGGIRMPQLTTVERNNLTTPDFMSDVRAKGLTIYNTDSKCMEYWNTHKWVSLCSGSADIGFLPKDPSDLVHPPEGGTVGPFTPVETPPCTGKEPYTYVAITGDDFISIDITDHNTGAFKVNMSPNTTAVSRTAIVRVTNNCTGEYKEFLFNQDGDNDLCDVTVAKPIITMSNGGVLCIGGDVFMEITNVHPGANYIWTINNIVRGQGTNFRATQSGIYKVYVGGIGCDKINPNSASDNITVTLGAGTAPNNSTVLYATNNGVLCGNTGEVTLTVYNFAELSELAWYKDGKKTNKTGDVITLKAADIGVWTVLIERDGCTSLPSEKVTVSVDDSSSPLKKPKISINGKPLSELSEFCSNGRLKLSLSNPPSDYTSAVTVKWYNGLEYLGEGKDLTITAPSSGNNIILRCIVSDNTGVLCTAEFTETKKLQGVAPATPAIVANPPLICGSVEAQLTASVTGGPFTFQWYKEGVLMENEVNQTLAVTKIGSYQVEAINVSGCISPLSAALLISLSDFPILEWKAVYDKAELKQTKIFQVSDTFNPTSYTWTADNGAVIENGQGTNTAQIKFPNTDTVVNVTIEAENDCGISNKLTQQVTVAPACVAVAVKKTTMFPTGSILTGNSVTMSVLAEGSNNDEHPITYQWKFNGTPISGATLASYTINDAKTTNSGNYTCVINNCSNTPVETTAGTIEVIDEATLPKGNGTLAGEDCFDIASASSNNAKCGLLTVREAHRADFNKSYTYTFTSVGNVNTNLRFVINDPEKAIESYEIQKDMPTALANGGKYTVTIKYKQSLMTTAVGRDNDNPFRVTLVALYKTGGVDGKSKFEITIKDCSCCSEAVDLDGNVYTAKIFGDAGCWMTQNLRTTVNKNGKYLSTPYLYAESSKTAIHSKAYLNTGTVWYTVNNVGTIESRADFASKFGLLYKNTDFASEPCPEGWHIPTYLEWANLIQTFSENNAGKEMKANNNTYKGYAWAGYPVGDSKNSGFNAYPSAYQYKSGVSGAAQNFGVYSVMAVADYIGYAMVLSNTSAGATVKGAGDTYFYTAIRCAKN
ncbi:FISUMP domain-containing protein [Flavobacterium branchiarum]|uniref:FISUMP domain-containing protein n=1 Tax=Flavobacterium branchiarum TaxID=1114870 RepID=A0ABV5FJG8_9FLAO|nr:FISUMP domain-containing protein [Flavobacterium branchiarum]MDN3675626.1 FISUMP domain-containing protein [Flavobacterium branchiarum]